MTQMTHLCERASFTSCQADPDFAPLRRSFVRDVDSDVRNSGASRRNTSEIVFVLQITGQRAKLVEKLLCSPPPLPPRHERQDSQCKRVVFQKDIC